MENNWKDVLARSEHSDDLEKLLENERNRRVQHSGRYFYYYPPSGGRPAILSGLLPALAAAFWPRASEYGAKASKKLTAGPKARGIAKSAGGSIRGSEVHGQIDDFVHLSVDLFKKKHARVHPYLKRLVKNVFYPRNWTPVESEFKLFDEETGIGTAVDVVCVDERGVLHALEIKTGYETNWNVAEGAMEGPFSNLLSDSPRDRAAVQVLFELILIAKHHKVRQVEGWVVHITDANIVQFEIGRELRRLALDAYRYLAAERVLTKIERSEKRRDARVK